MPKIDPALCHRNSIKAYLTDKEFFDFQIRMHEELTYKVGEYMRKLITDDIKNMKTVDKDAIKY